MSYKVKRALEKEKRAKNTSFKPLFIALYGLKCYFLAVITFGINR
jgi:hypothetical protein